MNSWLVDADPSIRPREGARPLAGTSGLFLVWGPESHGPRSVVFARELGIPTAFIESTRRRGLLAGFVKYPVQAALTAGELLRRRPRVIFVQSPPSFAVMVAGAYAWLFRRSYVIDAHSDAFQSSYWMWPRWLHRLSLRRAVATIVTNEAFAASVTAAGGTPIVIRDIPTSFPEGGVFQGADRSIVVVSTFAVDEPLQEVLRAAATLPEVTFYVTGDSRRYRGSLDDLPANVRFTGFLSSPDYYALLRSSAAVMCLTTRDNTMQRGACEALSLGKPIITSDWPLLRTYFDRGTVHVDNTSARIAAAVREVRARPDHYQDEVSQLQASQRAQWRSSLNELILRLRRCGLEGGA
ncbi:MAG TPA: glycosyltransferase [Acidimicrobiales bacterium]|nr:glycosyltransferase [Acidimicrobiales bacterium]